MTKNFLKLARMLMKFAEVKTDKGSLIYDGELTLETPVQIEDAEGNIVAAPDGDYTLEDGRVVVVTEGKVAEIKEAPIEEETVEEVLEEEIPTDESADKIADLEAIIAEQEAVIDELKAQIKELEDKINAPKEESIEMSAVAKKNKVDNPVLKYFN